MTSKSNVDRYKYLYSIARNHNKSRNEILELISGEYHKIKNAIAHFNDKGYESVVSSSSKLIQDNFNDNIKKEFGFIPPKKKVKVDDKQEAIKKWDDNDDMTSWEKLGVVFSEATTSMMHTLNEMVVATEKQKKDTLNYRLQYLLDLYYSLSLFGLHKDIYKRKKNSYSVLIKTKTGRFIKWNINLETLQDEVTSKYENSKNRILLSGKYFRIEEIEETYIASYPFLEDEIPLYSESKGISYDGSPIKKEQFIYSFENVADSFLPSNMEDSSLDDDAYAATIELKDLLIIPNKKRIDRNEKYKELVSIIKSNSKAWVIISPFIKDYHSYDEFYENKGNIVGLKPFITESFKPLIAFLESKISRPIDSSVRKSILVFDNPEQIIRYWEKSKENIELDPEEAISRSKALLESILKQILESEKIEHDPFKDDFPKLYKLAIKQLNLSPGNQHQEIFNQILNGCKSVVEGINAARGKWGSSHGKNNSQLKNLPLKRHAELVVNLSGSMAIFLIQSWKNI